MAVFGLFKRGFDPDTFEKELNELTESIVQTQQSIVLLRLRYRGVKRICIQWLVMAYVLLTAINWIKIPKDIVGKNKIQQYFRGLSTKQLVVVLAYPVLGWVLVKFVHWLFNLMINRRQRWLVKLQKKHELKIDELKKITNFNTTSKLLKKYEDEPKSEPASPAPLANVQTTALPPTANVKRRNPTEEKIRSELHLDVDVPDADQRTASPLPQIDEQIQEQLHRQSQTRSVGDRILDLLLGSDHNESIENRYALVCHQCFTHNGLAPPGCTNPLTVKYRCLKCGALNGGDVPVIGDNQQLNPPETKSTNIEVKDE